MGRCACSAVMFVVVAAAIFVMRATAFGVRRGVGGQRWRASSGGRQPTRCRSTRSAGFGGSRRLIETRGRGRGTRRTRLTSSLTHRRDGRRRDAMTGGRATVVGTSSARSSCGHHHEHHIGYEYAWSLVIKAPSRRRRLIQRRKSPAREADKKGRLTRATEQCPHFHDRREGLGRAHLCARLRLAWTLAAAAQRGVPTYANPSSRATSRPSVTAAGG